jgi:hypothetical protein
LNELQTLLGVTKSPERFEVCEAQESIEAEAKCEPRISYTKKSGRLL